MDKMETFPKIAWSHISKIEFEDREVWVTFNGGNGFKAETSNPKVIEEFKKEAIANLEPEKIIIRDSDIEAKE